MPFGGSEPSYPAPPRPQELQEERLADAPRRETDTSEAPRRAARRLLLLPALQAPLAPLAPLQATLALHAALHSRLDLQDQPPPAREEEEEPSAPWRPTLHAPRADPPSGAAGSCQRAPRQQEEEEAACLAPSAANAAPPPGPPLAPPATRAELEEEVKANRQLLAFAKQQPAAKDDLRADLEALANGALDRCHRALQRLADEDAALALSADLLGDSAVQPAPESRPPVGYWPTP